MALMDAGEICRDYNAAKYKKRQIKVLAELNGCNKEEIMKILVEGGCELPKKEEPVEIPQVVQNALFTRLEQIEGEIKVKEKEIKEKEAEYREITDFLKECKTQ